MNNQPILATIAALAVATALLASPSASAEETVLIDSTFEEFTPGARVEALSPQGVPLKQPTSVVAEAKSSVVAGTEPVGPLLPPYALFQVGETKPGRMSELRLRWELPSGLAREGAYELSYSIVPLQDSFFGGMVQVHLTSGGKDPTEGQGLHRLQYPLYTVFRDNMLRGLGIAVKAPSFSVSKVVMTFDLDNRTWGISINNRPLLANKPMPAPFNDPAIPLAVSGVSLASWAGAHHTANHEVALGHLKLVRKP